MAKQTPSITLWKKPCKDKLSKRLQKKLLQVVFCGRLFEKMADHSLVNRVHPINTSVIFHKYKNKF